MGINWEIDTKSPHFHSDTNIIGEGQCLHGTVPKSTGLVGAGVSVFYFCVTNYHKLSSVGELCPQSPPPTADESKSTKT